MDIKTESKERKEERFEKKNLEVNGKPNNVTKENQIISPKKSMLKL